MGLLNDLIIVGELDFLGAAQCRQVDGMDGLEGMEGVSCR